MQSNLTVTSYKPTFGMVTSNEIVNLGQKCKPAKAKNLYKKIDALKTYGFDNYTMKYRCSSGNYNKQSHIFYTEYNGNDIVLIRENNIQKAINQFINLTKYDLLLKIK